MRTALSQLAVARPRDLAHALRLMSGAARGARPIPIAGGTDLFVYLNAGTPPSGRVYLDLWGLDELRGVRADRRGLTVGALTTFSELREHALVRRRFPALAAAAAEIGARQIQNRATLGGNIANASPAGDSLPPLMALGAVVHTRSARGSREIPFAGFFRGYRDLEMAPDELITEIRIPFPPAGTRQFFRKVGTRRAQSISKVVCAGLLRLDRRGAVDVVHLAYGSVAPVTLRARGAELALLGHRPTPAAVAEARAALCEDISPIDDIRSDREYRLAVAGNLLEQFLRAVAARSARA
jgi:CO/xanthine dehydrogenase FAD-binding subunit